MNIRRAKPVIESLVIPSEKIEELNRCLAVSGSPRLKTSIVRKIIGAHCYGCDNIPTRKVSYDLKGAKLLEFYCDTCFPTDIKNLK